MRASVNGTGWSRHAKGLGQKPSIDTLLREAKEAGYAGVEIGDPVDDFGSAEACRERVRQAGLEVAATFANVTYNPWPPNAQDWARRLRNAAAYAEAAGGSRIVCVCGGFPITPRRTMRGADYDLFATSLRPAVELAASLGLTIAFHPHRGCIVETARETAEILARVPQLKLCIDTAHLAACGDDPVAFVRSFAHAIVYAHMKDYRWDADAFTELGRGDGCCDVAACVAALRERGYDGWLTVELDGTWKEGMPTALESARISRAYLRDRCGV